MARVVVVGGSLSGLAASSRLAKAGHDVVLLERRPTLGGSFARAGDTVLDFPAPWRDLFKKSGRPLSAELARAGLDLVPAPDQPLDLGRRGWFDARRLQVPWPTDRAAQWHLLVTALGRPAAERWRDFVDAQDAVWLALRPLGLEGELVSRAQAVAAGLHPTRSLADAARGLQVPRLARLVTDVAARAGVEAHSAPAWLATRLSVTRTFGRWRVVDAAGEPQPTGRLLDLLVERVRLRGVEVRTKVSATAPRGGGATTNAGPVTGDALIWTPAPAGGVRWRPPSRDADFLDQLLARPPIRDATDARLFRASGASTAGPEPWARLLSAALAVYACHEVLTGEDIRPTNKALGRSRTDSARGG